MAQTFSVKKYLSKIFTPSLISELASNHNASLFFEINDQTPRKLAIQLMEESIKSLDTEQRLNIIKDLSFISSITNSSAALLGIKLFKENIGKDFEPEIECKSDADIILYLFLRHEEIIEKVAFLFPFYASKSYISYIAKNVEQAETEIKLTELSREFTRIANKDNNATEQEMEYIFLENILYIESKFQGSYNIENKIDSKTGEIDKRHAVRKIENVRIAYIPNEETILIAGNTSKQQKMIFLDTFLRIICNEGYEGKVEVYNMSPLKNLNLDFTQYNKGTPFIKASIKSVTLAYAEGKKRLRIALPSSSSHSGMQILSETLTELGLENKFESFNILNMTFAFMFQNKEKPEKSINVSCSISPNRASLCSLFQYERYTKSILKNANIYEGWKIKEEE